MHVNSKNQSPTKITLTITADNDDLKQSKKKVLQEFAKDASIAGFRKGKAPLDVVEKNVDQDLLQRQFLEIAVSDLYPKAAKEVNIRPVEQPQISVEKFVPFETLEFAAEVSVLGEVKLTDYKKIKKSREEVKVTDKEVAEVVENLRTRSAEKEEVTRAAKDGDQVLIDFTGTDKKGEKIAGADGTDYPLALGSKTFIPGFEEELVGAKTGDSREFTLTFPKDYGVKSLANQEVTFKVTIKKIEAVKKPKADDVFAKTVGPVASLADLKKDIKKELTTEKQRQADLSFESELVGEITEKSKLEVPQALIDEHIERMMQEFKQNLSYRGQTLQEFLETQGMSEVEYKEKEISPEAEKRVKASVVLSEVAEQEKIEVTPEELEIRMQVLKGQYNDPQMQEQLDKPEGRREIASRMLSEKTVAQLAAYATQKRKN